MVTMYACFQTTDRLDIPNVVDFQTYQLSETPIDGYHCVDPEDHPDVFVREYREVVQTDSTGKPLRDVDGNRITEQVPATTQDGLALYMPQWFEGWENLPTLTYTPEEGFREFDPYTCISLKRWWRREKILQPTIQVRVKQGTELKHYRKALLAIIDTLAMDYPDIETHPAITALRELSAHIDSCVAEYPKEQTDTDIDLHAINSPGENAPTKRRKKQ